MQYSRAGVSRQAQPWSRPLPAPGVGNSGYFRAGRGKRWPHGGGGVVCSEHYLSATLAVRMGLRGRGALHRIGLSTGSLEKGLMCLGGFAQRPRQESGSESPTGQ